MMQRLISVLALIAFLNCLLSCTSTISISVPEIPSQSDGKITKVIMKSGHQIIFDEDGGKFDNEKKLIPLYS